MLIGVEELLFQILYKFVKKFINNYISNKEHERNNKMNIETIDRLKFEDNETTIIGQFFCGQFSKDYIREFVESKTKEEKEDLQKYIYNLIGDFNNEASVGMFGQNSEFFIHNIAIYLNYCSVIDKELLDYKVFFLVRQKLLKSMNNTKHICDDGIHIKFFKKI